MRFKVFKGLSIQFLRNAGESRCYPKIRINYGNSATGKRFQDRALTFHRLNYDEKYREACRILRDWRGLKRVPSEWYNAQPDLDEVLQELEIVESVKHVYDYA